MKPRKKTGVKKMRGGGMVKKMRGDVTMKDVLIKRGVIDKQGKKVKKGHGGTHRKKK